MLFNFIVLVMIGAVAYFHYSQGMVSSVISMVIALFAAAIAVGYHESLVPMFANRLPDSSIALAVTLLFAVSYFIPRLIFDKFVPGNVRVPLVMDKGVAIICGLIAALASVGVMSIAFQSMPWSETPTFVPSRLDYKGEQIVTVPRAPGKREMDAAFNETMEEMPGPDDDRGMWIPADRFVIGLVSAQSSEGALAADRPFTTIHPSFLQQLYMGRLGIETGGQRSASNLGKSPDFKLADGQALFAPQGELPQLDAEIDQIRKRQLDPTITSTPTEMLFVVRVNMHGSTVDGDRLFRFSPGAIRLVANGRDFHPIGTLEDAKLLVSNRIDDFIFAKPEQGRPVCFDLVFKLPKDAFAVDASETTLTVKDGVFIEIKRLARFDLSKLTIAKENPTYDQSAARTVLRKTATGEKIKQILPGWTPGER